MHQSKKGRQLRKEKKKEEGKREKEEGKRATVRRGGRR